MPRGKNNPFYLLYGSLIERVHGESGGFNTLSEPEKLYYATTLLRNEVNNGGFHQYFFNSSGSYYRYAEKGLIEMGAIRTLELLHRAKDLLFADKNVPGDTEARRDTMPNADSEEDVMNLLKKFEDLDQTFYSDPDDFNPRLEAFARKHRLVGQES